MAARRGVHRAGRTAGALYLLLGVGFGLPVPFALERLRRTGTLPMTPFGFRAYAGGPFDPLSVRRFAALGGALAAVCLLDVVAGIWLWQGRRRGAALGLATEPLALALGYGFALPLLLIGIPIRLALVLAGRRALG